MKICLAIAHALLASVASAVFLENAFKHEHIAHFVDGIDSVDLLSANSTVGLGNDQLISVSTTPEQQVEWAIDLRGFTFDSFVLVNKRTKALLFSPESNIVHTYRTTSGNFINDYNLDSNVLQINNFFNKGALALTSSGSLYYLNDLAVKLPIRIAAREFLLTQIDGNAYILADKLVRVNPMTLEISTTDVHFTATELKDDLVRTTGGALYRIVAGKFHKIDTKVKNFAIVNSNYILSDDLVLYKVTDSIEKVHQIVPKFSPTGNFLISHALSDFLVVSGEKSNTVYDLTDFVELDDPSSIKEVKVGKLFEQTFVETDGLRNLLVTLNSAREGVKYDLTDGTIHQTFRSFAHSPSSPLHLLIDKPSTLPFQIKNLEENDSLVFVSIIKRLIRHLSELGRYIVTFSKSSVPIDYGFGKLIVGFDDTAKAFIATDSESGLTSWELSIQGNVLNSLVENNGTIFALFDNTSLYTFTTGGELRGTEKLTTPVKEILSVDGHIVLHGESFALYSGELIENKPTDSIYVHSTNGDTVSGYKLSTTDAVKTWSFKAESLVSVYTKPLDTRSSSIALALADKQILYKYLYKNTIAIVTKGSQYKLYLLDGITGKTLHVQRLPEDIKDGSLRLIMDDNWIVYTYLSGEQQRINVVDLFDSVKGTVPKGTPPQTVFGYNTTIETVNEKSFVFPEKIVALSSTQSRLGITTKSILLLTVNGKLLEVPKVVLNSRRIDDRPLNQADMQEFRISAYDPVIKPDPAMIVNHKHKLFVDDETSIYVLPTHFESTLVVCVLNKYNRYIGLIQPSLSFDLLGVSFASTKLLVTIGLLFAAWAGSKWSVDSKRLRETWIDRE